ncbi:MAG: type II TA system antitoxin MqsA family protein, partial [Polyangiaceae bacterium]
MSKQGKKCRTCGEGETKTSTENHLYVESGLPNVVLAGVNVRRCAKCGAFEVLLPRVTELHRVIANAVIHKPARLSGAEVKFLRKHLGWSGADFAAHMGVDPTTVSAWENERKPFGTSSDRLLRPRPSWGPHPCGRRSRRRSSPGVSEGTSPRRR